MYMMSGRPEVVVPCAQNAHDATPPSDRQPGPSGVNEPPKPPSVQAKRSLAIPIWLAVIVVVLGTLYLQMRTQIPSYNFLIEGDHAALGARVMIDGQHVGDMVEYNESGVNIVGLRVNVADGQHTFIVSKPGCNPVQTRVAVTGADYLFVRLTKQ